MTRSKSNPEHILQADCVREYSKPEVNKGKPNAFWANFSETDNFIQAGIKTSLGMKKSIPDTMFCPYGELIGIEFKIEGSRHNTEHVRKQAEWMIEHCKHGYFCTSVEGFLCIIERYQNKDHGGGVGVAYSRNNEPGRGGVVKPEKVLEYIKNIKTKTFSFNTCLFEK